MRHWQIQWKVEPWKGLYWCCSDGSLRERIIGRFNRSIGKWLTIELWNLSLKFLWSQPRLNIMGVAVTISWFFFSLCGALHYLYDMVPLILRHRLSPTFQFKKGRQTMKVDYRWNQWKKCIWCVEFWWACSGALAKGGLHYTFPTPDPFLIIY